MKIFVFICVVLLAACSTPETTDSTNPKSDSTATKVDSITDPIEALNLAIRKDPNNAVGYYKRAQEKFNQGNKKDARTDLDIAFSLDSSNANFYVLAADMVLMQSHALEAKALLEQAMTTDAQHVESRLKYAEILMFLDENKRAITYANEALRIDKFNAKAYYIKGMCYKYLQDTSNAVSAIQTAVEQNPNYYDAQIQLGLIYASVKHPMAEMYYNNAIKLRPGSVEAIYNKCMLLQETGKADKALEGYELIKEINPNYADAYYNSGYVLLTLKKDYLAAIAEFEQAIQLNPEYAAAHYNVGLAHEQLKEYKKAESYYRSALKIQPQFTLAAKGLGRLVD